MKNNFKDLVKYYLPEANKNISLRSEMNNIDLYKNYKKEVKKYEAANKLMKETMEATRKGTPQSKAGAAKRLRIIGKRLSKSLDSIERFELILKKRNIDVKNIGAGYERV